MNIAEKQNLKGQNAELVKYFKNTPTEVKRSIIKDYNQKYTRREVDLGRVLSALLKKGIAPLEVLNHFRNTTITQLIEPVGRVRMSATIQFAGEAQRKAQIEEKRNNEIVRLNTNFENLLINKKTLNVDVDGLYRAGLTSADFLEMINNHIVESDKMILKVIDTTGKEIIRPLTDKTLITIDNMRNGSFDTSWLTGSSDPEFIGSLTNNKSYSISRVESKATYSNKVGKFFPYLNTVGEFINLEKYGVYKELTTKVIEYLSSGNCLMLALGWLHMSKEKVDKLKYMCLTRFVSKSKLKVVCKGLDISITLYEQRTDGNGTEKTKYGKNINENYEIALYEGHYFVYDTIPFTAYSITNILTIQNQPEFNLINKVQYKNNVAYYNRERNPPRFIKSLDALILLNHNKKLTPMTRETQNILKSVFYDNFKPNYDDVSIHAHNFKYADKDQQEEYEIEAGIKTVYEDEYGDEIEAKDKEPAYIVASFDFETRTDFKNGNKITAFVGSIYYGESKKKFSVSGSEINDVGRLLLEKITGPTLLLAHNAKFDYGFISQHLTKLEEIMASGRFITAKGFYKMYPIKVIDFYNFVPSPLSTFGDMFKIPQHKEFMPYELYNDYDVITNKYIDVLDVINNKKYVSTESQKELFLNNCKKWKLLTQDKKKFDALKYCVNYCELDCVVLYEAFNTFRGWISEAIDIDILTAKCLTASSISRKVLQSQSCLVDCHSHSGSYLEFMSKFCIGGRTMCSNNEKHIAHGETDALDANSLYPSAIVELGGYLKGKPKRLNSKNYEDIKNNTGYFVRIRILKVGVERSMPLISKKDDDGIRIFTNDLLNDVHYVDKITLEDLIEFQKIEFEIIDGFYYNQGRNTAVVELINTLYDTRKECVANGNPMELVYKSILNSAYGINLENPHDEEIRIFDKLNDFEVYLDRKHQTIKEFMSFGNKTRVISQKEIGTHFNTNHIGCEILSMSKRIMNRVICLAEDKGHKIYYQDTDSLFIDASAKDMIIKDFEMKYNRPLIGADLGQFKGDLKIKYGNKTAKNTVGVVSVFLGKKCYYIKMKGERDDGTYIEKDKLRMAGIPASTLEHTRAKLNITNQEMYEKLYSGEAILYDLCEHNDDLKTTKFRVMYDKNLNKTLKTEFTRTRKF